MTEDDKKAPPPGGNGLGDAVAGAIERPLVSPNGLARNLAVSTETIKRLVQRRHIPFIMVGGRYRFDVVAVRIALAERTRADDEKKGAPK